MWVRNNKGNVFVGNLPPDFPDERLAETFDPYGIVLSASVARDPDTGARLRYGFVDIATEKAASQAITALDGIEIDGCKLNVKASERKQGKGGGKGNGARRPTAGPARRPPFRAAPPRRTPIGAAEISQYSATAREPLRADERPDRPDTSDAPQGMDRPARPAQSSIIAAELGEMEPPPRRDFEVVHKPVRRRTTPNFQVERRTLPRRS
ncbi:MAG TPA: RNA-binding protein [Stellaceae bacterium]|jgi:RNA recognition motif-containing protein